MPETPELPAGLTTRPLRTSDATAVHRLMAAQELEDIGEVAIEEADIVSDWAKPSHDLAARSIGVWDGDTLVAYAELMGADRADTSVLPSHRGRGIGTWLAHWLQDLGRRVGSSVIGMPVPQGSPGDRLLEELGFHVRWTSWVLKLPAGATIPERELPEGYVVRAAEPGDMRAAHDVLEDAFLEWSVRDREPYEDFEAATLGRPGFEPWNLRVAVDGDGQVVGVSLVLVSDNGSTGYVDRLAVRADQRHRGIAQALLVDSFAQARAHGTTTAELSTDSRTGALGLYQRVGMVAESIWVNRAIDLT
ncbi:GNAT family N-acetyltransferase [Nocardioides ganghwensis]|jgi:mycothiol synthase|uniref:GNAT family N-acetyltransferase n=1 Tax=Nocardioides ganghwensis TaxID=252230 RepID=A0A4Q2SI15_9ACTN|nr:GNAT family N-acetyltransferase [Nocardioides ganghwensis]MBD3944828.1 GNAT family N-acetyltransferase [Nocardioides ganghwensis]RYC05155.1 GNAT family N-acetyltransferase [Nocardioides ganghwensis]